MPQVLRPDNIPSTFTITGALTAQMVASVSSLIRVTLGGQQYTSTSNLSLNLATTGAGGLDTGSVAIGTYYLYLVVSGGSLALVASLSTAPSGFSVYKQIERVRVGINESSALAILDIRTEAEYLTELAEVKNNYIINGAFDFWQRNVTFSTPSNGAANADRFKHFYDGAGSAFTISRQNYALGFGETLDGNPKYYHRLQVTTAGSGSTVRYSRVAIEGVQNLAGKVVTLSFYAAADSNRTIRVQVAQIFGTGGSPSSVVSTNISNINITNVFTKYNVTFRVPSISGKTLGTNGDDFIEVQIHYPLNTVMTVDLGQMMLNDGAYPATFARAGNDLAGELLACQRYYETGYLEAACGAAGSGQIVTGFASFKQRKRAIPVMAGDDNLGNSGKVSLVLASGAGVVSNITISGQSVSVDFYRATAFMTATTNGILFNWSANAEL